MANMHLVTGYANVAHIKAEDIGSLNAGIFGINQAVLGRGNKLAASIVTNNTIRVLDGDIVMQGRHARLNEGSFVDLSIDTGTQGYNRNDLIVARYEKNTGTAVEEVNLVVIKGTATTGTAADPEYTSGNILEGDVLNDMPLYRVPISGVNIGELVCLFTSIEATLHDVGEHIADNTKHITAAERTSWNGKAPGTHNHSASAITSGVFGLSRGGTGASTADAALANIGAMKNSHGVLTAANLTTWAKNATVGGSFTVNPDKTNSGVPVTGKWLFGLLTVQPGGERQLLVFGDNNGKMWMNTCDGSTWLGWVEIYTSLNKPSTVVTGSYEGTGVQTTEASPKTLTFPFTPKVVIVASADGEYDTAKAIMINGAEFASIAHDETAAAWKYQLYLTWGSASVSFYSAYWEDDPDADMGMERALNADASTYRYVAIG